MVLDTDRTRALYALLLALAVVALVALALATSAAALLGLVFLVPAVPALRTVTGGATGRELIPVLQRTGTAELLYAAGAFVGLLVG